METTLPDLSKLSNVVRNEFVKKFVNDDLVNKVMLLIQTRKIWKKKKIKTIDKNRPDSSKSIIIQEFNRLTKINFNARKAEESENLETEKQRENSIDLGNKDREKKTSNV